MNYRDLEYFVHLVGISITTKYGNSFEDIAQNVVLEIKDTKLDNFLGKYKKRGNPNLAIKNLMNSWYTESYLNFPSPKSFHIPSHKEELFTNLFNQKEVDKLLDKISIEYGSWNYIKMYYSFYFSLSSMLRCIDLTSIGSHKGNINKFCNIFLSKKFPSNFLCYPFSIHSDRKNLEKDKLVEYLIDNKKPIKTLMKNKQKISLIDFFYFWRIFINYSDLYKFQHFRDTIPIHKKYKTIFSNNLKRIIFLFNIISEVFFIKCYDYKNLEQNFNRFKNIMHRVKLTTYPINLRFGVYDSLLVLHF